VTYNQNDINVSLNTPQSTVIDALNTVGIDLTQYLEKDEIDHFHVSLKAKKPYFLGTN